MHLLYSVLLATALLLSLPWWLLAMLRHGKYRAGLAERFGRVPRRLLSGAEAPAGSVWVHAVSVGELLAVSGLIEELRRRLPDHRIIISTTTAAGQKLARDRFGEENVFFFPLDFAFAIRPYVRALRPSLVVVAETEFWPNFLAEVHAFGARIAVVNARISDRSLPRYRLFRGLMRRVLGQVDLFLAQSEEDARRLAEIGAERARIRVTGNLKFDAAPPKEALFAAELRQRLRAAQAAPVLVCGSTVEGEEPLLLEMFQCVRNAYPNSVMVLAPRRPERFAEVAQRVQASGVPTWRRSELSAGSPQDAALRGGVLVLDTIGELAAVYSVATIALVGGSLVPRGGHNILEPAFFGVPILVGPHTENFRDIVAIFRAQNAVRIVRGAGKSNAPNDLTGVILGLLADEQQRELLGRRAAETLRAQTGATQRTAEALQELCRKHAGIRSEAAQ
jgi:3-deoxy-D-manno-octulosonic-acid transferase